MISVDAEQVQSVINHIRASGEELVLPAVTSRTSRSVIAAVFDDALAITYRSAKSAMDASSLTTQKLADDLRATAEDLGSFDDEAAQMLKTLENLMPNGWGRAT